MVSEHRGGILMQLKEKNCIDQVMGISMTFSVLALVLLPSFLKLSPAPLMNTSCLPLMSTQQEFQKSGLVLFCNFFLCSPVPEDEDYLQQIVIEPNITQLKMCASPFVFQCVGEGLKGNQ